MIRVCGFLPGPRAVGVSFNRRGITKAAHFIFGDEPTATAGATNHPLLQGHAPSITRDHAWLIASVRLSTSAVSPGASAGRGFFGTRRPRSRRSSRAGGSGCPAGDQGGGSPWPGRGLRASLSAADAALTVDGGPLELRCRFSRHSSSDHSPSPRRGHHGKSMRHDGTTRSSPVACDVHAELEGDQSALHDAWFSRASTSLGTPDPSEVKMISG